MRKYVEFIETHKKTLYLLLVIIIILAGIGIRRIKIDTDFTLFMPGTSEYKEILDDMNKTFSTSEQMTILMEKEETALSFSLLENLRNVQKYLVNMETIEHVSGPAPESIRTGDTQINLDHLQEDELNLIEQYYRDLDQLSPVIYREGKIYGIFNIFPGENFGIEDINRIESFLDEINLSSIGLSALLFSPIRLHLYVSILMWIAMMSGVFFSLTFLPSVLKKVK